MTRVARHGPFHVVWSASDEEDGSAVWRGRVRRGLEHSIASFWIHDPDASAAEFPDAARALRDAVHLFNLASNPFRLRVLVCVIDGARTIEQICETLGEESRIVSQYLQALAQAKLIQSKRQGRFQVYTPRSPAIN